jgi:hypothetical protein
MFKKLFGGTGDRMEREHDARLECIAVREEIMVAVFADADVVAESISIHLRECEPCRAWETEIRKMHGLCRESGAGEDPSPRRGNAAPLDRYRSARPTGAPSSSSVSPSRFSM